MEVQRLIFFVIYLFIATIKYNCPQQSQTNAQQMYSVYVCARLCTFFIHISFDFESCVGKYEVVVGYG